MITPTPVLETPTKIADGRARRWAHIANKSDVPMALKYDGSDTPLTFANGIPLAPGAVLMLGNTGNDTDFFHDIFAIVAAAPGEDKIAVVHQA